MPGHRALRPATPSQEAPWPSVRPGPETRPILNRHDVLGIPGREASARGLLTDLSIHARGRSPRAVGSGRDRVDRGGPSMTGIIKGAVRWAGLGIVAAGLVGCHNEAEDQAAQTARDALGVQTKDETAKTQTQQVLVEQQTKGVDPKTGETISQNTKVTPVTVEKTIKTDVDVNVGETKSAPKP